MKSGKSRGPMRKIAGILRRKTIGGGKIDVARVGAQIWIRRRRPQMTAGIFVRMRMRMRMHVMMKIRNIMGRRRFKMIDDICGVYRCAHYHILIRAGDHQNVCMYVRDVWNSIGRKNYNNLFFAAIINII